MESAPPRDRKVADKFARHQLDAEIKYTIKNLSVMLSRDYQSRWAIYTDARAYNNQVDPVIYQNWHIFINIINDGKITMDFIEFHFK